MFILNAEIISIPLEELNLITLIYYSKKSELLNIYDTNYKFDENIIPLITSVLEVKPTIIKAKRYCNIDSESLITFENNELPNTSHIQYPSFLHDIQQNGFNMKNIQGHSNNLVNTIDINEDKMLLRMYKLENKHCEFGKTVLNEEELLLIVWNWEYINFQIIINRTQNINNTQQTQQVNNTQQQCQLQINIYITEDNKIIISKLENINKIITKISTIINEFYITENKI